MAVRSRGLLIRADYFRHVLRLSGSGTFHLWTKPILGCVIGGGLSPQRTAPLGLVITMAKSILDRFQVALITGGSGGLGKKMASNLISHGKKIVIAGRSMDKLDAAAQELGPNVIGRYAVDVGNTATLAPFVEKVVQEHPEVDCVINNAGIQNLMNYAEKIDVSAVEQEISINVTSVAILCALFAPHLQSKQFS